MRKKILRTILILAITVLGYYFGQIGQDTVYGAYKDGEYVNIYGSGYVSCKEPDSCNNLYIANNSYCTPDSGTCKGDSSKDVWALKLTCSGGGIKECGNGIGTMVKAGEWSQGTLNVSSGTKCNQTVQIDVFDKKCDANGSWDPDCNLIGYMVWYSGACPAETPVPACNTDCSANQSVCQQATGGCTECLDNGSGGKTCQAPPTTSTPACNTDCSSDQSICQQATGGCTECRDNGAGGKTCQAPPGTTPTGSNPGQPGPQCNDDCSNNPGICSLAGPGCNTCNPTTKRCGPPPGTTSAPPQSTQPPAQPSATPTPDFNEAMCKCDGITASQIIAGQPAVFTATSKVTGSDVSKAEAKQIEFALFKGNDPRTRKVIAGPERVNTTSSGGTSEVTYQAQWTTNIPATVEKNVDYQVRATIKCTRKTTAHAYPYTAMVLGESDRRGIFSMIADFFRNIFGGGSNENTFVSDDSSEVAQDEFVAVAEKNNLQLGSFAPAKVVENKCPVVKFRFE